MMGTSKLFMDAKLAKSEVRSPGSDLSFYCKKLQGVRLFRTSDLRLRTSSYLPEKLTHATPACFFYFFVTWILQADEKERCHGKQKKYKHDK